MSGSSDGLINQIQILQYFCKHNGLTINFDKTKIMTYNTKSKYSHLRIIVDKIQHSIEVVEEYKYLGMWISKNNKKHLESLEKMAVDPLSLRCGS